MSKSIVYFINKVDKENIVKIYDKLGVKLNGKVAIKLHSGEKGNQNYLRPQFFEPIVRKVGGTVVECNTAYGGARNETKKHLELMKEHEWSKYFNVDIMDASKPDLEVEIPNGKVLKKNYLGKDIANYDSMLVLSHFKGHPMGGFGGAIKQLSIGCASSAGKCYIHSAGVTLSQNDVWSKCAKQDTFLEAMADAASSVVDLFKGNIVYINVMANMSVDCDCCVVAEDPCIPDMGILTSTDPVAIDQACIDIVTNSTARGKEHFLERVNSRHGIHTLEAALEIGLGNRDYELIKID